MISRIWHGYTSKLDANTYEDLLKEEIFPGIEKKSVKGYKGIQLLRRDLETEVEFTTIMWFNNMESVKQFAGDDYETAYVPENEFIVHCCKICNTISKIRTGWSGF